MIYKATPKKTFVYICNNNDIYSGCVVYTGMSPRDFDNNYFFAPDREYKIIDRGWYISVLYNDNITIDMLAKFADLFNRKVLV